MSAVHGISLSVLGFTGTGPVCDLESSAIESPAILAIDLSGIVGNTTAAFRIGLGLSSNTPVGVVKYPFLPENFSSQVPTSNIAITWTTAPAVPASFFRMVGSTNNPQSSILWTFPRGLKVNPNSSMVIWKLSATFALTTHVSWEIEV